MTRVISISLRDEDQELIKILDLVKELGLNESEFVRKALYHYCFNSDSESEDEIKAKISLKLHGNMNERKILLRLIVLAMFNGFSLAKVINTFRKMYPDLAEKVLKHV